MAMFIRVKRKKTTYFIACDPTETVMEIKQKLESLTDHLVGDQRLILLSTEQVLEDAKTLAQQKVENDAAVALTVRQDNGSFENINIEKPEDHHGLLETDVSAM